jgi:DNA polymerase-3 subunit delta
VQLRPEQIPAHLGRKLAPVYLVAGEEPLLVTEVADAIRTRARELDYTDREVLNADAEFDWRRLGSAGASMSLFAARRLVEVRMPGGRPGDEGSAALQAYAAHPPEDTVLLVISGKLDKAGRRGKWVQALDNAGVMVMVWPVDAARLPAWVRQRMLQKGLRPTPEAAALVAERVEGNLMACVQEIEKLLLLHGPGPVDAPDVAAMVGDSARFDVFDLVDSALGGEPRRTQRILQGLRGEGVEAVLVLWALAREVRMLESMAWSIAHGEAVARVVARWHVWASRKAVVEAALGRIDAGRWQAYLARCALIDRVIKGQAAGNPWDELLQLALDMAGQACLAGVHTAEQ